MVKEKELSEAEREDLIRVLMLENTPFTGGVRFKVRFWSFTVWFSQIMKRVLDIIASASAILVLSPFLLLTAVCVKLNSPGPIIFRQIRVGLNGRHFNFYKFRSMYMDAAERLKTIQSQNESADGVIFKMKNDPRITDIGRFIRKYSIDELPQLFNVLAGDMSLVGPRPQLPSEVAQYTLEDHRRLQAKPGLTCLWQISGRSDIAFRGQVKLDLEYMQSQSFWRDIWILLKTVPAVLTGKGAY